MRIAFPISQRQELAMSVPVLRLIVLLLTSTATTTFAQSPPLTGRMLDGVASRQLASTTGEPQSAVPDAVADTSSHALPADTVDGPVQVHSTPPENRTASTELASRPGYRPAPIGTATRNLLRQQVNGNQAGATLPVLGASASLSYQRYLDSFKHPIPERFESRLSEAKSGAE